MGSADHDRLVGDAADAVAWHGDVHWDRRARLATPAGRRMLDNLRALAPMFAASRARVHATTTAGTAEPQAGAGVPRAAKALVAIAGVEVAVAVVLLPLGWADYRRAHGDLAGYFATQLIGYVANACLLLFAGRFDRRTWLLGAYFLLRAPGPSLHLLMAMLGELPPPPELDHAVEELTTPAIVFGFLYAQPIVFAPAFLWAFARECPRVLRETGLEDLARRMVRISVGVGCGVLVACAASLAVARTGHAEWAFPVVLDLSIAILDLSPMAAMVVVALRAHTAPAAEVRRVVLFSAGFLLCVGPAAVYDVFEVFAPGYWLANYQWSPAVALIELGRFPGVVLLWCSVLAARVPHRREVIQALYGRLLRWRVPAVALGAAPPLALGWLVASRPEREVGAVVADPLVQALSAVTAITLLLAAARERIRVRLEAWVYPEMADQRQLLAAAADALAHAGSLKAMRRTVARAAQRGCGSTATLLAATDAGTRAPGSRSASLPRDSAIAQLLETTGGSVRVHPDDERSVFALLPHEEASWVVETAADAMVAVPGPGAELLGVLVVGRRFDDRLVRPVDIPFLEALGAAAGLALGRLRLLQGGPPTTDAPPAVECPVCRSVRGPDEPPGCDCGQDYVEVQLPRLLAGKYRLARRLGAGGMGAVYVARDLRLDRDVAVKTVTETSSASLLMGLQPEALAMATVTHPAVAQIHTIESWRGRPFLVVELLAGGTLADRLARGPVPAAEAASLAAALAEGLAALHEAGYLHGDVKPSNVGFTSDGAVKLLDFGLARETGGADALAGTLRYLSPEVLSGRPAEEGDDVWSLCVVLYEMVTGRHPFGSGDRTEVADGIRRQRLAASGSIGRSEPMPAVLAFAESVLTGPRSTRPATASAFGEALHRAAGKS